MSLPAPSPDSTAAEAAVQSLPPAKRMWVLPMLRVLEQMGGSGRPKDVQNAVFALFEGQLNEAQRNDIIKNARMGWTRMDLVAVGMLTGERGTWALTALSRSYLDAHRDNPTETLENVPEGPREKQAPDIETEAVDVTDFRGYDLSILECLNSGLTDRQEILNRVGEELKSQLLPGDFRRMASGHPVHSYRTSWGLSQLNADGFARNASRRMWEITEKGRERLARERDGFRVKDFQGHSKAKFGSSMPISISTQRQPNTNPKRTIFNSCAAR